MLFLGSMCSRYFIRFGTRIRCTCRWRESAPLQGLYLKKDWIAIMLRFKSFLKFLSTHLEYNGYAKKTDKVIRLNDFLKSHRMGRFWTRQSHSCPRIGDSSEIRIINWALSVFFVYPLYFIRCTCRWRESAPLQGLYLKKD